MPRTERKASPSPPRPNVPETEEEALPEREPEAVLEGSPTPTLVNPESSSTSLPICVIAEHQEEEEISTTQHMLLADEEQVPAINHELPEAEGEAPVIHLELPEDEDEDEEPVIHHTFSEDEKEAPASLHELLGNDEEIQAIQYTLLEDEEEEPVTQHTLLEDGEKAPVISHTLLEHEEEASVFQHILLEDHEEVPLIQRTLLEDLLANDASARSDSTPSPASLKRIPFPPLSLSYPPSRPSTPYLQQNSPTPTLTSPKPSISSSAYSLVPSEAPDEIIITNTNRADYERIIKVFYRQKATRIPIPGSWRRADAPPFSFRGPKSPYRNVVTNPAKSSKKVEASKAFATEPRGVTSSVMVEREGDGIKAMLRDIAARPVVREFEVRSGGGQMTEWATEDEPNEDEPEKDESSEDDAREDDGWEDVPEVASWPRRWSLPVRSFGSLPASSKHDSLRSFILNQGSPFRSYAGRL